MPRAIRPSPEPLFTSDERAFLEAIAKLIVSNFFLPERIAAERAALGRRFIEVGAVWNMGDDLKALRQNLGRLREQLEPLVERARARLADGRRGSDADHALYCDGCHYLLYDMYDTRLQTLIDEGATQVPWYGEFARDHARLLGRFVGVDPPLPSPEHLFACFFQIRRAFHYIFWALLGSSPSAARLRAMVWRAIFSHDLRRYVRSLFHHKYTDDSAVLIMGPSGTGKEVVARAIGLSRYVAFDPKTSCFVSDHTRDFHAVNLAALSPSLVESELFGHERGAFTGALVERSGRFSLCKPGGTLFLDEIGELDTAIQVKLLRVAQGRRYERVGGVAPLVFSGRILAATNADLGAMVGSGKFREDLYYRLCSIRITTPSLREQLIEAPGERRFLVRSILTRVAGTEEIDALTDAIDGWLGKNLPRDYPWPGNVRELEQAVRNLLWLGEYDPLVRRRREDRELAGLDEADGAGPEPTLTLEQAMARHVTLEVARTGSYSETARRLGIDRRTVGLKVDRALLAKLLAKKKGKAQRRA